MNDRREQEESRRVFAESLPRKATTMHAFALADAATPRGRYTEQERSTVVGANPVIDYPAGPAWCADPGSQLLEPPLGFDNPALEPSTVFSSCSPVEQPDGPLAPSTKSPSAVSRSGPSSFSTAEIMAAQCRSQMSSLSRPDDDGGIERPPSQLRRRRL
jgi:hypothetical protein